MKNNISRHPFVKVPEITAYFWIIKVLTTALGESTSDYMVHVMNPVIAKLGGAIFGDRRYDNVFIYHNGAESYYGGRGFRGLLRV